MLVRNCALILYIVVVLCKEFLPVVDGYGREARKNQTPNHQRFRVIQARPASAEDVKFLGWLMVTQNKIDFWSEQLKVEKPATFTVPEESAVEVGQVLRAANISYKEITKRRPIVQTLAKRGFNDVASFDLNNFNNLDAITDYLRQVNSTCSPEVNCELYSIGQSHEGRDILVIKISKAGAHRKGFWIDATIHAREWITTTTALKLIDLLISGRESRARQLVDSYDWYICPVLNPDGYVYTFSQDRFWRKNRNPSEVNTSCIGVDLNRNFDFHWGTEGISHDPCSPIYCGTSGGSESEVQAVQKEAVRLGSTLLGWVTLHAYGNFWIFPYGHSVDHKGWVCERTSDHSDLMEVANAAADATERTYSTRWLRGTSCEVIYETSGSSMGYVKDIAGVKYSYGLELRGEDFVVQSDQIEPSFVEVWNGISSMCSKIEEVRNRSSEKGSRLDLGAVIASLLLRLLGV